jgi:CheY-like chemotaxis protein
MVDRKIVLAVDDMATQLVVYKSILSRHYDVIISTSAIKAIDMLRNKKVDIILIDIEMPEMTGIEFLRVIREEPHLKEIPVIVISGYKDISDALRYGANDYMKKPVDPAILRERIKKFFEEQNVVVQ